MDVSEVVIGKRTYVRYGTDGAWHIKVGSVVSAGVQYFRVSEAEMRDALNEISRLHDVLQTYSDHYER